LTNHGNSSNTIADVGLLTLSRIQCKGHGDKEDDSTICPDK